MGNKARRFLALRQAVSDGRDNGHEPDPAIERIYRLWVDGTLTTQETIGRVISHYRQVERVRTQEPRPDLDAMPFAALWSLAQTLPEHVRSFYVPVDEGGDNDAPVADALRSRLKAYFGPMPPAQPNRLGLATEWHRTLAVRDVSTLYRADLIVRPPEGRA